MISIKQTTIALIAIAIAAVLVLFAAAPFGTPKHTSSGT